MNRKTNSIGSMRLKYLVAILSGIAAPQLAGAQGAVIEEVVVTGSRIQRVDNTTAPQPISTITSEDMTFTGSNDISEILKENPALLASELGSAPTSTSNVSAADNVGGSALNLRGLGTERTLTLVNGRRHVAGIEGTSAVDVGTIPSALIERVEVLTGGASAVYGADAVTGIVNFILKDDFEGSAFDFRIGSSEHGDAETYNLSGLFGRNFGDGRGNVVFGLQADRSNGLRYGDRDYLSKADGPWSDDVNPALRFQHGDIDPATMPNFSQFYDYDTTGLYHAGFRIPSADSFMADYAAQFGGAPTLTDAELALIERAATATPRAVLPGRTYNVTSPYGVVVLGDFRDQTPLGSEPDLDGDGTPDCLQSFTGYNSDYSGGCWYLNEAGQPVPYQDGLIAGNFNHFGAAQSYIAPERPYIIPKSEKYSANLNARYDITPSAEIFVESKYVYEEVEFGGGSHHATDWLYGAPDNPYLPAELQPYAGSGLYISRDSDDWGDNLSTNERHTYRLVTGLRGAFDEIGLDYEVAANYGRFDRKLTDREAVITDRFFAAIDAVTDPTTGNVVCRSDLDPTAYPYTTPFNFPSYLGGGASSPFFTFTPGDGQCKPANIWAGKGGISQEAIDFFTYDREVEDSIEQSVVTAFVTGDSSMLFDLPAGPIAFALGAEWREEKSSQDFDSMDQGIILVDGVTPEGAEFSVGDYVGDVSAAGSLGTSPGSRSLSTDASYHVWDVFAEASIPLLSGLPLVDELTLDIAGRRADYSTFGSNTTWGTGLVWAPHEDVRLRANFSKAIRVPNLFELYSPEQGQSFRPVDPCDAAQISSGANPAQRQANCVAALRGAGVQDYGVNPGDVHIFDADGSYAFEDPLSAGFPGVIGGNEDLLPEEATTKTFGIVYAPYALPGLSMSVDFWDISIEEAISEVSSQRIVDSCYDSASINNPFCELTARNSDPTSAQAGGFVFLRQTKLNFGEARAEGVDLNIAYQFDLADYAFNIGLAATKQKTLEFIEPANPGEPEKVDIQLGEMRSPEWSGLLNARVSKGPLAVAWRAQYLSEQALIDDIETLEQNYGSLYTDDFTSHRLSGTFDYSDTVRLYGGIDNLTDERPYVTSSSYPVNPVGRSYYMGINIQL
ncbi:TonB-dependent receptor domain-containing protein [Gilvimarinus sp. F26214L]|uniref:TonB-dependent receptor domain-containing protein n=1 Tax=Gilvimarinus sp. DZF01 TaxID=3461371 RepID=UPI004045A202